MTWWWPHPRSATLGNQSCMHMITLREFVAGFRTESRDTLSSKSVVIARGTPAKLEPTKDYKRLALSPRQWEEPSSSRNPQSDISSEEHLKILLRFQSKHYLHDWFTITHKWITSFCIPWDNYRDVLRTITSCINSESCIFGTWKRGIPLVITGS